MDCRIIKLNQSHDTRGNLTHVESGLDVPFEVKRVYWMYDIPSGEMRAGHAHKTLQQLLIAVSGSFDIVLENGESVKKYHMNNPNLGLYIAPMVWRDMLDFSSGAVCLALASDHYSADDYIRSYSDFLEALKQ